MGNKSACLTFLFPLLFVFCSVLSGQEASWFLDKDNETPRFIQRLAWAADEYALRYEVVIESEEAAGFREILRESTGATYIEISLPPGKYRYGVTVFDLLGRSGPAPEWISFEIIEALEPEPRDFFPAAFYLDEDSVWVLNLTGQNLSPDAEVYLRRDGSAGSIIVPDDYSSSPALSGARLVFSIRRLIPGNYEVYIKNPGGLEASLGTFRIAFRKPVDFYVGLDYAPLFPLYGELNQLLDQPVFPLGGQIRFGIVPFKQVFGYLGLELVAGWHYFHTAFDNYEVSFQMPGAELNILFQKWLSNRVMALTFRIGGGFGMVTDFHFSYSRGNNSEPMSFLSPRAAAGVSFLYLMTRSFFVEAGAEYMYWFTVDYPSPQYLRPRIGAGWKF
ncbi:hypothetical protein AGMMS49928_11230 [Spirochaetia bacterium]|nr:hypothetical protein AGMMS49928_11230 [Spirochaetia bacterium]